MSWSSQKTDLETNFLKLVNFLKKITFSPYHKTLKDANVLTPVIFNAKKRKKNGEKYCNSTLLPPSLASQHV